MSMRDRGTCSAENPASGGWRLAAAACVFALGLAMAPPLVADARAEDANEGEQLVSLDFDDVELADVIDTIARMTNRNFIYDDRVRGRVTIVSPTPIPLDQAYAVFESVLQVKGFTTVETPGGALKVIPLRDAKETNVETVMSSRQPANRDRFVTRLIPLRYIEADSIVTTLKPLVSKDASMAAYADTNTVILTESASNIRRIIAILEAIDIDTYQDDIAIIQVEYADASVLAAQLAEIYGAQVGAGGGPAKAPARSRRRAAAPNAGASSSGAGSNPLSRVRLITDERTNSLITIAPTSQLDEVRQLIRKLDVPVTGGGQIHVYYLQHADAEELAQTLAALIGGAPAPGGGAPGGGQAQALRTAVTALAEGIRVTADPATNALVIQARKEGYDALIGVIEMLDVERPQVLVEALIMEADVSDGSELGFDGIYRFMAGDLALQIGTVTDAAARGAVAGATGIDTAKIPGSFFGTVEAGNSNDGSSIKGIIRATANDSGINIISAPHILTQDNEEAEIRIGDNIPIITSRVQSAAGITTDGLSTSVNVERQDIGVTLRVTPQITEGESLRLEIFQEITDVNQTLAVGDPNEVGVPLTSRRIENTVVVKDGDTVVIGGLISDRYLDSESKVPFLGDIPVLGWAFKSAIRELKKVNLLVFLTPHIVRSPTEMEYESIRKREEFIARTSDDIQLTPEERWQAEKRWLRSGTSGELYPPVEGKFPVRNRVLELAGKHPSEKMETITQDARAEEERKRLEAEAALTAPVYVIETFLGNDEGAATDLLIELIDAGYDGYLTTSDIDGALMFQLRVGPYEQLLDARNVGATLARSHDVQTSILVVPRELP
jgi:general secretion pathway protein D